MKRRALGIAAKRHRRRRAVWTAAAGLVVSTLVPGAARADDGERPLADAIVVDGQCLTASDLAERIGRHLGRSSIDARVRIVVFVESAEVSRVTVSVLREGELVGVRRFGPLKETCARLGAVVSVTLAVAIDQLVFAADAPPVSPREPEVAEAPPVVPQAATSKPPPPREAPPPTPFPNEARAPAAASPKPWRLGADAVAGVGILPTTAFGLALSGSRALAPVVRLRAGALAAWSGAAELGAGTVTTWLVAGRIDGCYDARSTPLSARVGGAICVGFVAGGLRASGDGFARPTGTTLFWPAAALRGEARYKVSADHAIVLGADLIVPLLTPVLEASPGTAERRTLQSPAAGVLVSLGWSWDN